MKRTLLSILAAAATCAPLFACTSTSGHNPPSNTGTSTSSPVSTSPLSSRDVHRLEAALGSIKASVQASVLAGDFSRALHGVQHVIPAGTSISIQPATLRTSGNYAVVRATVAESGAKPASIAMLLTRPKASSPWQVVTLLPTTATTAYTADTANDVPATPRQPAASGGCNPVATQGKTPVILIHGFNGGPGVWGQQNDPASMRGKIGMLSGVQVSAFDYQQASLRWVTDPRIGRYLGAQIMCLAEQSHRKVVVVAHSMGGLALKDAIKEQPGIIGDIGLVVTVGTPNDGSLLDEEVLHDVAGFCAVVECGDALKLATTIASALPALATGSPQIAALPQWPDSLPVYAIGGNIAPQHLVLTWSRDHLPHFTAVTGALSGSDTLVTISSALHGQRVNGLGGTREFDCTTTAFVVLPFVASASCEHVSMLGNPSVQEAVVAQIREYLSHLGTAA